ncbi:MAG: DNA recombination protein RmuC [Deltaproteobacteria bacterium]|nr:DNA recombination protein RmuC [Deltaproteobacteria bacterium]MBW2360576.1 DNA recombination protein RmuC [Deltaproteobacteria bacterium]
MAADGGDPGSQIELVLGEFGLSFSSAETAFVVGLLAAGVALLVLTSLFALASWRRLGARSAALDERFAQLDRATERSERALREELTQSREETSGNARHLREELAASLKGMGDLLANTTSQSGAAQKEQLDSFQQQLHLQGDTNAKRIGELTTVVGDGLGKIREESGKKLDEMRATVDEKLQGTLEKRLGEAFQQVSERLEAVHKGLGEMQNLAIGVGDLKKVLTNVRSRGAFGEVQLDALLEQVLAPGQYERQVITRPGSAERVDFAVRLPGADDGEGAPVWLPIDAKFPHEDFERLLDALERSDANAAEVAARALERRIKSEARSIRDKYVSPPHTTDFALLFVPTESLFAELLRRPGLIEWLQRECRVSVVGPTTCLALLNSLQMGFRTLAIQKRSNEAWTLLSAVRTQFGKFGEMLAKVDKKLQEASNTIGDATKKTRYIETRLRKVAELPENEASALLPELTEEASTAEDSAAAADD